MTEARSLDDDQPTLERPSGAAPEPRFTPGTLLAGRYRVIYSLGRGGMGDVYRADDLKLGQAVALKFVRSDLPAEARQRLYTEVRLGRQVSHPNVCRLYDVVEVDGLTFIAMEYVDGEDLASLLVRIGHLPSDKALAVACDLCAGLQAAHDRGVVHRDLKPANVMIDGHGRARLTDFGLAVESQAAPSRDSAGTALYMSPEQLAGGEITFKSDLYSLGLIFYEMVAGRRFFQAGSLEELRSQHRADRLPRLSALSGQVDPVFGRIVAQCLDEHPQARPASARALLAALPGGDPLEAAIAAGETPAPDVVAAAGTVGDLRPAAAWAVLTAFLGCLSLTVLVVERLTWLPKTPPPKSSDVLVERARSILSDVGHRSAPADWAASYEWDYAHFSYVFTHDQSRDRLDRLRDAPLAPIHFFYRQSPQPLVAVNRNGHVERDDPPLNVSGMAEVVLDAQGRLRSYLAVPPGVETGGPWPEPDWSLLFREAQLDPAAFHAVPPEHASPVDSDRKGAWEGRYPGMPETTVRLEAAAYHGRPVWFVLIPPWAATRTPVPWGGTGPVPFGQALGALLAIALPLGGFLLVRRNLRLGRGDRKGAFRLALFVFATYSLARLFRADHNASFGNEFWLLIKVFAYPLAFAALMWVFYMAVEPYARRQWPRILISWSRLLAGRWQDPMVGRDLLVGAAAAAFEIGFMLLSQRVSFWLGWPQEPGLLAPGHMETLTSWRSLVYRFFVNLHSAALWSIVQLFMLVLLRVLLRRRGLALGAWAILTTIQGYQFYGQDPVTEALIMVVVLAILMLLHILVLTRSGVLGYSSMIFVSFVLTEIPLTFDASLWWAPRGWAVLAALVALAVYGFRTSLAGKPALGGEWLET
jgi:serine/threonine protein kinase